MNRTISIAVVLAAVILAGNCAAQAQEVAAPEDPMREFLARIRGAELEIEDISHYDDPDWGTPAAIVTFKGYAESAKRWAKRAQTGRVAKNSQFNPAGAFFGFILTTHYVHRVDVLYFGGGLLAESLAEQHVLDRLKNTTLPRRGFAWHGFSVTGDQVRVTEMHDALGIETPLQASRGLDPDAPPQPWDGEPPEEKKRRVLSRAQQRDLAILAEYEASEFFANGDEAGYAKSRRQPTSRIRRALRRGRKLREELSKESAPEESAPEESAPEEPAPVEDRPKEPAAPAVPDAPAQD